MPDTLNICSTLDTPSRLSILTPSSNSPWGFSGHGSAWFMYSSGLSPHTDAAAGSEPRPRVPKGPGVQRPGLLQFLGATSIIGTIKDNLPCRIEVPGDDRWSKSIHPIAGFENSEGVMRVLLIATNQYDRC